MHTKRTIAGLALGAAVLAPGAALAVGGFTDVPDDHQHAAGIEWVAANGITGGCTPTTYCPSDDLSRAQMATFLHRLAGFGADPSVNAALLEGLTAAEIIDAAVAAVPPAGPPPAVPNDPFAFATGATAFNHSGPFTQVPGASTSIVVPDGTTAVLEIAFSAESACSGAGGWCSVRILVDGVEAEPASGDDFAFDSTDGASEGSGSWEGHAMSRVVPSVGPGNHTVTVEVETGGANLRIDDWTLTVEGHLV